MNLPHSRALTQKSASNLALAFILLPREKRDAMSALYAFCRAVDDVADEDSVPTEKRRAALADWREDIRRACENGKPELILNQEFQPVIRQFRLPFALFDQLIMGCEMDLDTLRYENYERLELYCHRVASVVGLLSIEIFGYQNPACHDYAVHLGKALQLTNILRDVKNDAARGRIYLPLTELKKFNVTEAEILSSQYSDRYFALATSIAARAKQFYSLAQKTLPPEDRRSMVAAELMGSVYWQLLQKLERCKFDVFGPTPLKLSKPHKLALIFKSWLRHFSGTTSLNYGRIENVGQASRLSPSSGQSESGATPVLRRLIVNADDFGLSSSVNEAVIRAHREGILTSASLMVNEPGFDEAVKLARENPKLGVGLHLTLLMGHAALPPEKIPGLVNARGEFSNSPVGVGLDYFFKRALREPLRVEIRAQFEKFRATGLALDHVNGHLHLHLHPVVFKILMAEAAAFGIQRMRLTREPFWMDAPLARGNRLYRASHAAVYFFLSWSAQAALRRKNIRHTHRVFGLLQNARVDEAYVLKLLAVLPSGDSELYSHPSLDKFHNEFAALVSPRVRAQIEKLGIELIRYQDL